MRKLRKKTQTNVANNTTNRDKCNESKLPLHKSKHLTCNQIIKQFTVSTIRIIEEWLSYVNLGPSLVLPVAGFGRE